MSSAYVSGRVPSRYERLVARQARAAGTSKSNLVARYVIEKSLETEFPGISFRTSLSGREAYLSGHRVAVWEVLAVHNETKSLAKTADHFHWPRARSSLARWHMPKRSPKRYWPRVKERPIPPRLLADENTSHRFVAACRHLEKDIPLIHIATWREGVWLGLDDASLLLACAEANLVLVAFDRATVPWHAGQLLRAGQDHAGLILFRRVVRSTDYGRQGRLVADLWCEAADWDWLNRIVYLPKSPPPT